MTTGHGQHGQDTGQPETPVLPGVRYKTEQRTRYVDETVGGKTRQVEETYDVLVPVPPRDWDHILLRAVTTVAVIVTFISVAWTTASIGDLLALTVWTGIAYGAALVFDSAWVTCIAVEYLERYDPKRARFAQRAGWVFLAASVVAIFIHGNHVGETEAGAVGAVVAILAKGLWVIVLRHYAVPLKELTAKWLQAEREDIAAQRAISGELRRMAADKNYVTAAYGTDAAQAALAVTRDDKPAVNAPSTTGQDTETRQDTTPPVPQTVPSLHSIKPPTSPRPALRPVRTGQPSVRDTILAALQNGIPEGDDSALRARVAEVHGDVKGDTYRKSRTRAFDEFNKRTGEGHYP